MDKEKWEETLRVNFSRSFKEWTREQTLMLAPEALAITAAYGIDRDKILFESVESYLDVRRKALDNIPNPDQGLLFDFRGENENN